MTHKKAPQITTTSDNTYFIMYDHIRFISEPTSGTGYNTYTRKPTNKVTELAVLQIQYDFVSELTAEAR